MARDFLLALGDLSRIEFYLMKRILIHLTRALVVVFALGMLGFYVWFQQEKAKPEPAEIEMVEFPITPTSPTMFSTSKSGSIDLSNAYTITIPPQNTSDEPGEGGEVILMPGSKNINMPIFTPKQMQSTLEPKEKEKTAPGVDPFVPPNNTNTMSPSAPKVIAPSTKRVVPVFKASDLKPEDTPKE